MNESVPSWCACARAETERESWQVDLPFSRHTQVCFVNTVVTVNASANLSKNFKFIHVNKMTCRNLTESIVFLNHKAFVDRTYSSYPCYDTGLESIALRSELFHVVVPYDARSTRDETADSAPKSKKLKRSAKEFDEVTLKVSDYICSM